MSKSELKWKILLEHKKTYWTKNILKIYLKVPDNCPICNSNNIKIADGPPIYNPFIGHFIKFKNLLYLRQNTIYNYFPKTPLILLHYIIELFTKHNNNGINISKKIEVK